MRSFFNKPAWAAKGPSGPETEFYRRSEQTYPDIVAANREAHKRPKVTAEAPDTPSVGGDKGSKRPCVSGESDPDNTKSHKASPPSEPHGSRDRQDTPPSPAPGDHIQERTVSGRDRDSPTPNPPRLCDGPLKDRPQISPSHQKADVKVKTDAASSPPVSSPHPPSAPPVDDPIVQVLITSDIPSTKPLIVHRKMSQSLREVRLEWCRRQGFTDETSPSVHLTWRNRRLFDVTTCRSLGIKPGGSTSLSSMDDDLVAGPKELHIHMVAVTDNPLLLGRHNSPLNTPHTAPVPEDPKDEGSSPIKVVLRSPGRDDFKIKARPKTPVSKLVSAFRDKFTIGADREVYLVFDGDRLDPSASLQDYDIEDHDLVDVQIV